MRIIGGKFRGLKLAPVGKGDAAAHLRPTGDRVRENLFNLLQKGDPVHGACVLDLFAGTGALGLEALSRGARAVTFVDAGKVALRLLCRNIALCHGEEMTKIIGRDATRLGQNPGAGCTLVFLDPPYGCGLGERALASALAGGWLAPGATIVWEENTPPRLPAALEQYDQRRYGDTVITLARRR